MLEGIMDPQFRHTLHAGLLTNACGTARTR